MKVFYCFLLLIGVGFCAEKKRVERQASYTFPGPRSERAYRPSSNAAPVYVEEQDERDAYPASRRQFDAQPVHPQYSPAQARGPPASAPVAAPAPVYEGPRSSAPAPAPREQSAPPARRRASSSDSRANKYGSASQQSLSPQEDEVEQGPDPLTLLLQDSHFACTGKTDGYYADDSVNCQVFHYCVGGAKHSWMCPENTVFHQVHLNCVPDAQDICSQSEKFHFVNDYLYKPVDYQGPNNTARYSQRYYPDGYSVGDPILSAQEHARRQQQQQQQQPQSYAAPAPAPRAPPRQVAAAAPPPPPPSQPSYRSQPQSSPSYSQGPPSRSAARPSRPVESYPEEESPSYRGSPARPQSSPSPQTYRQAPGQAAQRQPSPQAYRAVSSPVSAPVQQDSPASHSGYSSEENSYPPQSQPQARRPAGPAQPARPTAGYTPPRQQYRGNARSSAAYPAYSSNQAAGVQYDEDY